MKHFFCFILISALTQIVAAADISPLVSGSDGANRSVVQISGENLAECNEKMVAVTKVLNEKNKIIVHTNKCDLVSGVILGEIYFF